MMEILLATLLTLVSVVVVLWLIGFISETLEYWGVGLTQKRVKLIKRVVNDYIEVNVLIPELNSESKKHFENAVNIQKEKLIDFLMYTEKRNVSRSHDGESESTIKVSNPHKREVLKMYLHLLGLKYEENKESIEIYLRPKNIFCEDEEEAYEY